MTENEILIELLNKDELNTADRQWLLQHLETTDNSFLRSLMEKQFRDHLLLKPEKFPGSGRVLALLKRKIIDDAPDQRHISRFSARKLLVAASLFIFIITSALYFYNNSTTKQEDSQAKVLNTQTDQIIPGHNNAVLTLDNGNAILLDKAGDGILAEEGNTSIQKTGDSINYTATNNSGKIFYNTITTARGNQYHLQLSDNTGVWLNASSSIRFPTAFRTNIREVETTGEVYFEVAKSPNKPFVVKEKNSGAVIRVLGTHFNVNGYADEKDVKISLLEGKIAISNAGREEVVLPGQQAWLEPKQEIRISNNVNMDAVMAWKNGKFDFGEKTGIEDIMRQVARWYDIEVEYKGKTRAQFWGSISRHASFNEVLKTLEATGDVRFEINGRKVIVIL